MKWTAQNLQINFRTSREEKTAWVLLAVFVLTYAALFVWLSLARHAAFQSHAFDLGNMDQAVWNTLHGNVLRFTDMEAPGHQVLTSRLAIHVEPLLIPISLLYLMHSGPQTLLVLQAIVVASGAIPAYLLAKFLLGSPLLALLFPVTYLLHPSLQNVILDDFHPVALSACFLMWCLYFVAVRSATGFLIASLLAVGTKEEIGLAIAVLGVIMLARGVRTAGIVAAVGGVGWFLISIMVIIPHFNPTHASPYLARYAYLGHGPAGVLQGIVRRPATVTSVLTSPSRLDYLSTLFSPLGYVPLVGFFALIPAIPALLINMLSADPTMYSGYYQYSAELVPFLVGAAVLGFLPFRQFPAASGVLSALLLTASITAAWQYGFTPLSNGYVAPSAGSHQAIESRLLSLIPADAVVAAADEIEPHLSDRRTIYLLPSVHPKNTPRAEYRVLDASIPSLPVTPRLLHLQVISALKHGFGVLAADDGILILRRGVTTKMLPQRFYSFAFLTAVHARPAGASWGPLHLVSSLVHPRNSLLTRSRPGIGLDTYWRTDLSLSSHLRIAFYFSPVYTGSHPRYSSAWTRSDDSPTWDWLPLPYWPTRTLIHAASLPLLPDVRRHGSVDVAVGVEGLGRVASKATAAVEGNRMMVRIATLRVGY